MNALTPAERARFLGGSDIAAVLGLSPWLTPVALWAKKTQPQEERPETGKVRPKARGHRWESVVAEMLAESLADAGVVAEPVGANRRYVDAAHDFMACEIDYELSLDGRRDEIVNCELKTVHPFKSREWGESQSDELPVHYTAQAMWGLGITGRQTCIVAALFGADELRTYTVERDDATIDWMREQAIAFWDLVQSGTPPQPVALRDLDILHPTDSDAPALIADPELTRTLLRMRAIDRELKARTAEWEALEFEVKRAMGDCTHIVVGSETKEAATWKQRPHTWLDQTALKEAHPDIVKAFTRKKSTRVFTLKSFSTEGVIP